MPRYIVKTDGFSIGSTVFNKGSEIELPEYPGQFAVDAGYLGLVGEYETRVMKPRRGRPRKVKPAEEA